METTKDRIAYASRIIREGRPTSRKFDGCLEEFDADEVCRALVNHPNPKVQQNLSRYIAGSSIERFRK